MEKGTSQHHACASLASRHLLLGGRALTSDGGKAMQGNARQGKAKCWYVPHLEMTGAGEVEPIFRLSKPHTRLPYMPSAL